MMSGHYEMFEIILHLKERLHLPTPLMTPYFLWLNGIEKLNQILFNNESHNKIFMKHLDNIQV